jgi:hypothetical protein
MKYRQELEELAEIFPVILLNKEVEQVLIPRIMIEFCLEAIEIALASVQNGNEAEKCASYNAMKDSVGNFSVQYVQHGSWPKFSWRWEVFDADGCSIANCYDKGVAEFICERLNGA